MEEQGELYIEATTFKNHLGSESFGYIVADMETKEQVFRDGFNSFDEAIDFVDKNTVEDLLEPFPTFNGCNLEGLYHKIIVNSVKRRVNNKWEREL